MAQSNGMSTNLYPSEQILAQANIADYDAIHQSMLRDPAGCWDQIAREEFEWFEPWKTTLDDSNPPFYQWFVGGKVNIVHNALDRHARTWRRNKLALVWEGENYDQRSYSYQQLHREVSRFASVLRAMGVRKGDRVTIYMGRIPELIIAMLACAKIGAVHSVVYGGFSVEALHERIEDSESRVAITSMGRGCAGTWSRSEVS